MTLKELVFPHDYSTTFSDKGRTINCKNYIKRCICLPNIDRRSPEHDEYFRFLDTTLDNSSSVEEFIDSFLADKRFINTSGYIELLMKERPNKFWHYAHENLCDRCFDMDNHISEININEKKAETDEFSFNSRNNVLIKVGAILVKILANVVLRGVDILN